MPSSDRRQYRASPFRVFPVAGESVIAYFPTVKRACIVSRHELEHLSACAEFATLSDHADQIVRRFSPSSDPGETREWLVSLTGNGALVSYPEILRLSGSAASPNHDPGGCVQWLVLPTCNRSEGVVSAIRSFAANIRTHQRHLKLFVSDQTSMADARGTDLPSRLGGFVCESGFEVYYADIERKHIFVEALCSGGSIPIETARFALFGRSEAGANIGATRNATLLQTVGAMLVTVDDDTVCETACAPESGPDVRFCGEADPTEAWFFGGRSGARAFGERVEVDFIGGHERLLGRSPAEVFVRAAAEDGASLGTACHHVLEHICFGGGQILSTYVGLRGDAGVYSAFGFLVHPSGATRNRLRISREAYAVNVRSREVARQALCATVSHGPGAAGLAACMGLDNRGLLPPFFPPFRSEDGVFAAMLARGREGSCAGHIPFTVVHDRPHRRSYGDVLTVRMSDLIQAALGSCPVSVADTPEERLSRCGKFFMFLGTRTDDEFQEWARTVVLARAATIAHMSETALGRDHCCPDFWAEDVAAVIERVRNAAVDPNYVIPEEVKDSGGLSTARDIIRQFGELTYWWPEIVDRTKALAESGILIGVRLGKNER